MNIFTRVKEFFMNLFKKDVKNEFDVNIISSELVEAAQVQWLNIIQGKPYWLTKSVKTINFAKFLCYYTAKKTTIDLRIDINGSERANYINKCIKKMVTKSLRDKVEDACGVGGIIFKPNGTYDPAGSIDYIMPGSYLITEKNSNGDILGIIFISRIVKGDDYYTRLEYHHFVAAGTEEDMERLYVIENKAYKSRNKDTLGKSILLSDVPEWENIQETYVIENVDKPLFGYFKMPYNNTIDYTSPEGVSMFSNCIKELEGLDIAWSRKDDEVYDSQHITFVDENAIEKVNTKTGKKEPLELPRFVRGLKKGLDAKSTIDEHIPTLLTEDRIKDINSILSMISTKAGFSQGQFILDRKTGNITATQIESDDSETVETINDIRQNLKDAIKDLIYALDVYCDAFFDMPSGYVNVLDEDVLDEDVFYFKDLMTTFEQDRARNLTLANAGYIPKWQYLVRFEGYSEEDAKAAVEEASGKENSKLFGEE